MNTSNTSQNKKAVLSQREPRDAAVIVDTYRIIQRHRTCGFPTTARLSCWSLSADCQKVISTRKKNQSYRIFNAEKYITLAISLNYVGLLPSSLFTANVGPNGSNKQSKTDRVKIGVRKHVCYSLLFVSHSRCRLRHSPVMYIGKATRATARPTLSVSNA